METCIRRSVFCWLLMLMAFLPLPGVNGANAAEAMEAEVAEPEAGVAWREKLLLTGGITIAEGISEITGVAVSPLLGMSALGAWTYWRAPAASRDRLPWYCQPYAWGFGFSLLSLCFLKDFLGAAAPALVKKPLDFAELFEDKISALVATTAFVPLVALAMTQVQRLQESAATSVLPGSGLAMVPGIAAADLPHIPPLIAVPVAIAAFVIVWLSSHAINVLIALSPFGIVDAGLKITKLILISVVAGSAAIYPPLGAVISLVLILAAALIAGWSYRLTVFGTLMGTDFLLGRRAQAETLDRGVKGFLARRSGSAPVRTYGKLTCDSDGVPRFTFRPWLMLPERHTVLETGAMVVCKGLVHPGIAVRDAAAAKDRSAIILLPRYRRLEEEIARRFGAQAVIDSTLMRGFKAMRQWLVEALAAIGPGRGRLAS